MPRPKVPGLVARNFRLAPADLARIERIERALRRRGAGFPTATAAVRWALAELDARLAQLALVEASEPADPDGPASVADGLVLQRPGPMTRP